MTKIKYRSNAPGGTRRRAPAASDKWGFPAGRTLYQLPGAPLTVKKGGNEEQIPGSPRTLCRLPASIKDGGVD
jgi:hypothetical protein